MRTSDLRLSFPHQGRYIETWASASVYKVNWTQDTQCFGNLDKVGQASEGWDWELGN